MLIKISFALTAFLLHLNKLNSFQHLEGGLISSVGEGGRGEGLYSGCNWIKFFCLQVDGPIHGALLHGGTHKWQFTLCYL